MKHDFALRRSLLDPSSLATLPAAEAGAVITQGRTSRLLASLAFEVADSSGAGKLDPRVQRHLDSAVQVHTKQRADLAYDCAALREALASVGVPLVLLKGGAYIQAGLPTGRGRLITDIDIIVPRTRLEAAEQALNAHGWESSKLDPYNESYYRRWSHEIPALVHHKRGTMLDLHHNILPPTAGPTVNADLLFERLRPTGTGDYTLSLQDMVIHSATHLFHEGEFPHGLRDLWDLDRMLRHFPTLEPDFWGGLIGRARALELEDSLHHGLVYAQAVFETPVPDPVMTRDPVGRMRRVLLDGLFSRAFRPDHPDCRLPGTGAALQALYIRSHYLKMPLYLLLPHLARKAWMRRGEQDAD